MRHLTRRQSIAALAGGGLAVGTAGAGLLASDEAGLVQSILHRAVGRFDMPEAQFSAFVSDLGSGREWADSGRFALFRAISATGPDAVLPGGPEKLRDRFETYERTVVTNFLTRTDYAKIDPRKEKVSFIGDAGGCSSPYARFDFT